MKKAIIINIQGLVFHIEEEAYEVLRAYMTEVKRHFGHSADSEEIVRDIEFRIAEMFGERIVEGKKEAINMQDVNDVIEQMGTVDDFEEAGDPPGFTGHEAYEPIRMQRRLMRDPDDRILGGVSSGLGHYFGIEARWMRLIFIVLFFTVATGLVLYLIMWIVVPIAKTRADRMAMRGKAPNLQNFKHSFEEELSSVRENFTNAVGKIRSMFRSAKNPASQS